MKNTLLSLRNKFRSPIIDFSPSFRKGVRKMKKLMPLGLCLVLVGCASGMKKVSVPQQPGKYSNTIVNPKFDFANKNRVAILPFHKTGQDGIEYTTSDKLANRLLEMGFTIVDRSQVDAAFNTLNLNAVGMISVEKLKEIGKLLPVDIIAVGTLHYEYIPNYDLAKALNAAPIGNKQYLSGESLRLIDVNTGEVMVSSYCCDPGFKGDSMIIEIAESIKDKIVPLVKDVKTEPEMISKK
jgi:hypothetical protein